MILLLAVIAGLLAGLTRARIGKRPYKPVHLRHVWLVVGAFIPQWIAFFLPVTRNSIPVWLAAFFLILSLTMLLVFALTNIGRPGIMVLGMGLLMNLIVIITNGGLMPISPENAALLLPQSSPQTWKTGSRFGHSKDIVLEKKNTRLYGLSDRFLSPPGLPYQFAFSLGDVLIAVGAFWVLWQGGG